MKMSFLAFDIETAKPFPTGDDWRDHAPLGIACVATALEGEKSTRLWYSRNPDGTPADQMNRGDLSLLLDYLHVSTPNSYHVVTWNGLGFDWPVLAEESGQEERCRQLALAHVDMMYHLFCIKGFPLGLAVAAEGMGLGSKTEGIAGAFAPVMWQEGKRQEVLDYCARDARLTLELATATREQRCLEWTARSGRPNRLALPGGWPSVAQSQALPEPDTSWMTAPMSRSQFDDWLTRAPTQAQ